MIPIWKLFIIRRSRLQEELSKVCKDYIELICDKEYDSSIEKRLKLRIWILNLRIGVSPYD